LERCRQTRKSDGESDLYEGVCGVRAVLWVVEMLLKESMLENCSIIQAMLENNSIIPSLLTNCANVSIEVIENLFKCLYMVF
jgi:hypothetical protein